MHRIDKKDLDKLDFKGIIVSVPKKDFEGDAHEFAFEIEDAYSTTGKHGYPEEGHNPSESSFFSVCYDMDYLPDGLFFNRTSGFTLEHQFSCDTCDYYKFDNMVEFCKWYLQKNGYTCTRPETTVTKNTYIKKEALEDIKTTSLPDEILEKFKPKPVTGLDISDVDIYSYDELRKKINPDYKKRKNRLGDVIEYVERRLLAEKTLHDLNSKNIVDAEVYKALNKDYFQKIKELEEWLDEEVD